MILPSFTFSALLNVILQERLKPKFADIDPETYNTTPEMVAAALTEKTRLVIVVHTFGVPVDVQSIRRVLEDGVSRAEGERTAIANLRAAIPLVEHTGVTLLVEAINSIDMPGYFADTVERAAALVEGAGSPSVRLQLDQYHVGMAGADARAALRRYASLVAHVQIADVPGRNQPGTGTQPIRELLRDLDQSGYRGSVGLEYRPRGTMEDALAWLPRAERG